jgi:hypothetical protein
MMQTLSKRLFRLQPGEAGLVFVLGLLLLGNALSQQITEITALSNFLNEVGVNQILIVWGIDSVVILLITMLQSLIIDRYSRIVLTRWLLALLGLIFVAMRILFVFQVPKWLSYGLLYVISEQQWLFIPLVFWILANDVFDMSQAKRLFPVIASGGFAGKLLGIGFAALMPGILRAVPTLKPEDMLILNTVIYFLIFALFMMGMRRVKVRQAKQVHQSVRETLTEGWGFVREVLSFRYLMFAMIGVSIVITVVDFHFLVVSDRTFTGAGSFQTFYSLYRLGLILPSIAVQSLLTSRVIEKIGLKNTFLIMPIILLIGSAGILAFPGIVITTAGIALIRLIQLTTDESARKAFQALVPEERRGRVSMFMDSYLFAVGTVVGCLVTGAVVLAGIVSGASGYAYVYLVIAVLASVFAVWATLKMRTVYDSSLFNWRLKRRQRRSDVVDKLNF